MKSWNLRREPTSESNFGRCRIPHASPELNQIQRGRMCASVSSSQRFLTHRSTNQASYNNRSRTSKVSLKAAVLTTRRRPSATPASLDIGLSPRSWTHPLPSCPLELVSESPGPNLMRNGSRYKNIFHIDLRRSGAAWRSPATPRTEWLGHTIVGPQKSWKSEPIFLWLRSDFEIEISPEKRASGRW